MSTNINISVGGNSLVDQAKAQQQASRQAQLEKEARQRLERQAQIERVNAFAAQGKDANGNPIAGAPQAPQFLPDEPAAFRSGDPYFIMLGPTTDPIPSVIVDNGGRVIGEDKYTATTKIEPPFDFQEYWPNRTDQIGPENIAFVDFKEGLGPSNLNAILFDPSRPTTTFSYTSLGIRYVGEPKLIDSLGRPYLEKAKELNIQDYTIEMYVKLDQRIGTECDSSISFNIEQRNIITSSDPNNNVSRDLTLVFDYPRTLSAPTCRLSYAEIKLSTNSDFYGSSNIVQAGYVFGTWLHIAGCRSGNIVRLFVNGIEVFQVNKPVTELAGNYAINANVRVTFSRGSDSNFPAPVWISRVKYSQKALYKNNFTPPTSW